MADTMRFDLVNPERRVASMEATLVALPGAAGDFAVGPGHEPVITTLRPGILRVEGPDAGPGGRHEFAVTGGFAEVGADGVTVLAERSMAASDLTQEAFDTYVEEAEARHRAAREGGHHEVADDTAKLLGDMVAMGTHVGLSTRQPNL